MLEIERKIQEEIAELENVRAEIQIRLRKAPEGRLRIAGTPKQAQYFCMREARDTKGIYIPRANADLAKQLAQKSYESKLLSKIEQREKLLKDFLEEYSEEKLINVYQQLNTYRKELVDPLFISDEDYAAQWISVEYEGEAGHAKHPSD